jgi:hypothetical protein
VGELPEWLLTAAGVGAIIAVGVLRVLPLLPRRRGDGSEQEADREKESV